MASIALVRAPYTYRYNRTDVREEVILTALGAYLKEVGADYDVYDFHLDRDLTAARIVAGDHASVVIAVRETGDNVHYALRLARSLAANGKRRVLLYGHTARLARHPLLPDGVTVVAHDERQLAARLGLSGNGPTFGDALTVAPYYLDIPLAPWQRRRLRGTIETSRGCPYECSYCFINAGQNHPSRWQLQKPETTMATLAPYLREDVRAFVFHDSEFFGGSRRDLANRSRLIGALRESDPRIAFKIYARADTIARFGDVEALRDAGLVSVFIGVESFVQADLDQLGKGIDAGALLATVRRLASLGVYMDLSFILFNRATTTATLRENLELICELYGSPDARFLGMPHFTFSFESSWEGAEGGALSGSTYVGWDVGIKSPPSSAVVFDPGLEPLMEAYRLLAYEWSRKVVDLSLARDTVSDEDASRIETWFGGLGAFCARTMLDLLHEFEVGRLTLASLPGQRERLFRRIEDYNVNLPPALRALGTYRSHAQAIDYAGPSHIVEGDEYWHAQIPDGP